MGVYFFGHRQPHLNLSTYEPNVNCVNKPERINDPCVIQIFTRFDLLVFQKIGKDFSWFIKGLGIPNETEVLSPDLGVSEICFTSSGLIGLNTKQNTLYKLNLDLDSKTDRLTHNVQRVAITDPSIKIRQIITNDKQAYGLDDRSGIYQISEGLTLKWRLENVEITKVSCGFGHFIALSDTGALYSWGNGGRGELGHSDHDHVMVKCEVPKRIEFFDDLPSIVKNISCGGWHTLALTSDGDVYSWGWNESGQLGHSMNKLSVVGGIPYPIDLGSAEDPIEQIACGARHSLAVLKSGRIFSWGLNKHGQLGLGDFENRQEPMKIKNFNCKPIKVECDRWSSCIYVNT